MDRLYRSRTDRVFTGLCAAIARALRVQTGLVRLVFLVLAVASGFGLLLYAVGTLLVPQEGTGAQRYGDVLRENLRSAVSEAGFAWRALGAWLRDWQTRRSYGTSELRLREVTGAGLVVLGLVWLLGSLGLFDWLTAGRFLALVLVGVGIAVLTASSR